MNREMIRQGFAWRFTTYSKERALADAETQARTAKRGLWIDKEPAAPWTWRKKPKISIDGK